MPKTTGPLLSMRARGQIGKTLVFSKWRGRAYAREYVVPGNPQTAAQTAVRDTMKWLQRVYKTAPALFTAPWVRYSNGKVMTDRNAFTKFNLAPLIGQSDLTNFVFSPGAFGGLPPAAAVATPGDDQISIAVTAPSVLPAGWTIEAAVAAVIRQQDPQTGVLYDVLALEDVAAAYVLLFTGLANAQAYRWGAWLRFLRPDGTKAYSTALTGVSTTT